MSGVAPAQLAQMQEKVYAADEAYAAECRKAADAFADYGAAVQTLADAISKPGFSTDFDAAALTAQLMKNPNSSIAQRLAFMGAMAKLGVDGETARFLWKLQKQCPSMDVAQLVALGGDFGVAIGKTLTIEEFILFLQALIAVLVAIPEFVVSKIGVAILLLVLAALLLTSDQAQDVESVPGSNGWAGRDVNLNDVGLDNLPDGWTVTDNNGFIHVRDANGKLRVRYDPPDETYPYGHKHYFDEKQKPLDKDGNQVDKKSPDAHIPCEEGEVPQYDDAGNQETDS